MNARANRRPRPDVMTDSDTLLQEAARRSWNTYYESLRNIHKQEGRSLTEPVRDRNLITTDSKHVSVLEQYCQERLARYLQVPREQVGRRTIRFKQHRSKSFDVCWPMEGPPKILISVKSMQNAYRNLTNRIEEAIGDSAVLRIYDTPACFGFFFFIVDGCVARGKAESAKPPPRFDSTGTEKKTKGVNVHLALVEEGGDFFDLADIDHYRVPRSIRNASKERQDAIDTAQRSLLDLLAKKPSPQPSIHYDAMALVPAQLTRISNQGSEKDWSVSLTSVDARLSHDSFFERLVETAKLRGFLSNR